MRVGDMSQADQNAYYSNQDTTAQNALAAYKNAGVQSVIDKYQSPNGFDSTIDHPDWDNQSDNNFQSSLDTYNRRMALSQTQDGLKQLAQEDYASNLDPNSYDGLAQKAQYAHSYMDGTKERDGSSNWFDKALPGVVLGGIAAITGGAALSGLGVIGAGTGTTLGAAGTSAMDGVGSDIASQLASGGLDLGSGIEAGVGTGAAGSGYTAAGTIAGAGSDAAIGGLTAAQQASMDSVGSDINSSLASGNLGADETANGLADYSAGGGTGVSSTLPTVAQSTPNTLKDYWNTAKNINSGLSLAKNISGLINPQQLTPSVGSSTPGSALTSSIGGLSQAATPTTISSPTYHDWQSYVAPGM